jgi:hypothetical protein
MMQHLAKPGRLMAGRVGRANRLAITASAAVLSLGLLIAAAPASSAGTAATGEGYTLNSGTASFTADGHTWHLQFGAMGGKLGAVTGLNEMSFLITTSYLGGTELHDWTTQTLPGKDFTLSHGKDAVLKTGSALAPVATFSLAFTATSQSKVTCTSGSATDYSGKLSGTVSLTTGLKGVKVSKHFTFSKPNTLEVSHACVPPSPCILASWGTAGGTGVVGSTNVAGPGRGNDWLVTVDKNNVATASKNLKRADGGYIKGPAPVFNSTTKSLTVAASSSGIVTGAGVLSSGTVVGKRTFSCVFGTKKYAETLSDYAATFAASKAFTARTLLSGTITPSAPTVSFFTMASFKKK